VAGVDAVHLQGLAGDRVIEHVIVAVGGLVGIGSYIGGGAERGGVVSCPSILAAGGLEGVGSCTAWQKPVVMPAAVLHQQGNISRASAPGLAAAAAAVARAAVALTHRCSRKAWQSPR
jgi:hypothetical protein